MIERIQKMADLTVAGKMFVESVKTEYSREDLFLSPVMMNAKRAKEYILNQEPYLTEYHAMTGYLRFSGDVVGDIFNRCGHENFQQMTKNFYKLPIEDLCTFEWQHFVADYQKVIRIGIKGFQEEIKASEKNHTDPQKREFLDGLLVIADAIIGWAHKCADAAWKKSQETNRDEYRKNLENLSRALRKVPEYPASSFYEAILTVYIIYAFVPDSIGCIDRYLYPFYRKDIESGILSEEDAKAYLQELFLMLQAKIHLTDDRFYRGGESHFCIGGYLENGEDGFTEFSKLVLDSLMELPTWIPQISLRWTKKTPEHVLKYAMECERKDPNKRIAFVSDEPRIKALTEIAGFPYEIACNYTMVGCNEPQLPGGMFMGGCASNIVKSMESTFYHRTEDLEQADQFETFYRIFEEELFKTLDKIDYYYEKFQEARSRDVNLVSSMFFEGSIERGLSITQGGCKNAVADCNIMGMTTVIDSLTVVKQFVYDEKRITMHELLHALRENWVGYEDLRNIILKKGKFFGNDEDVSNEMADRFAESLYCYFKEKRTVLGYRYLVGNLIGYNQHNKWFGDATLATPDGRYCGDTISFGLGQSEGKDRKGLTALLLSVAKLSGNHPILAGDSVTNVLLDKRLVTNDDSFDKIVKMFETYLRMGGLHFQLSYVSKEDLKKAKKDPEKYKNLRVRVSGFSDYFVFLNEDLQDEIITRTEKIG